eukprot:CAMPEP_0182603230 /NCGR_PEP_ID=MMETSP1324-20130603/92390_1 /TAXON_ID=236786 /ORGANISM="Florenciella sp., Strain RCC1587" /LENGTH=327 /DNA_ID=CAMNT_0024821161 /DNA_START=59 /DNA_END=1043 /DNA_ORIENTATION=+
MAAIPGQTEFVGTAGDMAAMMAAAGIKMPEMEATAKRVADAPASTPEVCNDPGCTHDHGHDGHAHGHAHGSHDHGGHDHKEDGSCCGGDHDHGGHDHGGHDHGHGHKEEEAHGGHDHGGHDHGHDHHAPKEQEEATAAAATGGHDHGGHDHGHGHKEEEAHGGHDHGHDHHAPKEQEEAHGGCGHDHDHGDHDHGHDHAPKEAAHDHGGHEHGHEHGHGAAAAAAADADAALVTPARIEDKLKASAALAELITTEAVDESNCGCGQKFKVLVVTDAFDGMPPLKRHRVVNEVLKEEIGMIHAITLKTFTQKQWGANGQAQWKACKDE